MSTDGERLAVVEGRLGITAEKEALAAAKRKVEALAAQQGMSFTTWRIGYVALAQRADALHNEADAMLVQADGLSAHLAGASKISWDGFRRGDAWIKDGDAQIRKARAALELVQAAAADLAALFGEG